MNEFINVCMDGVFGEYDVLIVVDECCVGVGS